MQDRNIHKALQTLSDRQSTLKKKDETFKNIQSLQGHNYAALCVAVLPNGNIISGSEDKTLKEWDKNTGQCLKTLEGHNDFVSCVTLLPNGNIISGSYDKRLKEWDTTGQCLKTLQGYKDSVACVTILPNGNIISGSDDKTLKEWNIATGQCLKTLQGHKDYVRCIAVLPNGNIISGSADKTLKVWETPFLSLSIAEMKKNASVLVQACRTKTSFFSSLPDAINKKIIAHTGNDSVHNEEERNKSGDVFYEQARHEHQPT